MLITERCLHASGSESFLLCISSVQIQLVVYFFRQSDLKINSGSFLFDSGVNYEEVLEQGDSVLVRDSDSLSYPGFELSRFNYMYICIILV